MSFETWKQQVNRHVQASVGLSADDLEDCPYRDWFDAKVKPETAAKRAIKRSGGGF